MPALYVAVELVTPVTSVVMEGSDASDDEKKVVGRAMRTTPTSEISEAYWAERGKGSRKKR
jgi:hypothetical protein